MANNNGIITEPVRLWSDVRPVLQVSTTSQWEMCTSAAVNKNSKCKPMAVAIGSESEPIFFADQTAREAAFKRACWGLTNIPYFNTGTQMATWMNSGTPSPLNISGLAVAGAWSWRKPTKYGRLGDFNKYYHLAKPFVGGCDATQMLNPYSTEDYISFTINGNSGYEITIPDIVAQGVMLPNSSSTVDSIGPGMNIGLCMVKGSVVRMVLASRKAAECTSSPLSFSIPVSTVSSSIGTGTVKMFLFLTNYDVTPGTLVTFPADKGHHFIPLTPSLTTVQLGYKGIDAVVGASISGTMPSKSSGGRILSAQVSVRNKNTSGVINITGEVTFYNSSGNALGTSIAWVTQTPINPEAGISKSVQLACTSNVTARTAATVKLTLTIYPSAGNAVTATYTGNVLDPDEVTPFD